MHCCPAVGYEFEIGDYCVGFVETDSFWYRTQIIDRSREKKLYRASIIDFGDVQDIPYNHMRFLNKEYSKIEIILKIIKINFKQKMEL